MAMVVCPQCRGRKSGPAIVCSNRGCRTAVIDCGFCKGTGEVSVEANERWQVGEGVREARRKRGLSQRELAAVLNMSSLRLNDIEPGRRAFDARSEQKYRWICGVGDAQ
jgi:DNA-binding XRE family transcriptional regulator